MPTSEPAHQTKYGPVYRCDLCEGLSVVEPRPVEVYSSAHSGPDEYWLCLSCRTKAGLGQRQGSVSYNDIPLDGDPAYIVLLDGTEAEWC